MSSHRSPNEDRRNRFSFRASWPRDRPGFGLSLGLAIRFAVGIDEPASVQLKLGDDSADRAAAHPDAFLFECEGDL